MARIEINTILLVVSKSVQLRAHHDNNCNICWASFIRLLGWELSCQPSNSIGPVLAVVAQPGHCKLGRLLTSR